MKIISSASSSVRRASPPGRPRTRRARRAPRPPGEAAGCAARRRERLLEDHLEQVGLEHAEHRNELVLEVAVVAVDLVEQLVESRRPGGSQAASGCSTRRVPRQVGGGRAGQGARERGRRGAPARVRRAASRPSAAAQPCSTAGGGGRWARARIALPAPATSIRALGGRRAPPSAGSGQRVAPERGGGGAAAGGRTRRCGGGRCPGLGAEELVDARQLGRGQVRHGAAHELEERREEDGAHEWPLRRSSS